MTCIVQYVFVAVIVRFANVAHPEIFIAAFFFHHKVIFKKFYSINHGSMLT